MNIFMYINLKYIQCLSIGDFNSVVCLSLNLKAQYKNTDSKYREKTQNAQIFAQDKLYSYYRYNR